MENALDVDQGPHETPFRDLHLPTIDASQPAAGQIYSMLRRAILNLDLLPNTSLSEAEIGSKVGASRTPVREALVRLRDDGLITTLPSRGTFVAKLRTQRILEAQFIREGLEMANVRHLATEGISDKWIEQLHVNIAQQTSAARDHDHQLFHQLDNAFHTLLAKATGFERAATVLEREKLQLDRLRAFALHNEGHLDNLLAEHADILSHVISGHRDQALNATQKHCRSILRIQKKLSRSHSNLFDNTDTGTSFSH